MFSANKRWTPPRSIHFTAEEGDLGFTLRGNSPVQVHFLDPYSSAAVSVCPSRLGAKLTGTFAGSQAGKIQRSCASKCIWVNEFRVPLCKRPLMDATYPRRKWLVYWSKLMQTFISLMNLETVSGIEWTECWPLFKSYFCSWQEPRKGIILFPFKLWTVSGWQWARLLNCWRASVKMTLRWRSWASWTPPHPWWVLTPSAVNGKVEWGWCESRHGDFSWALFLLPANDWTPNG